METKSDNELLKIALGTEKDVKLNYSKLSELFGFKQSKREICVEEKSTQYYSNHYKKFLAFRELYARALTENLEEDFKITSVEYAKNLAIAKLAGEKNEGFHVIFLNAQDRFISFEKMFSGSIDRCNVHYRPLVQRMLELNSSSLILVHNHPSGCLSFSEADYNLTKSIKDCLSLLDCRVLDHILIAGNKALSMEFNN